MTSASNCRWRELLTRLCAAGVVSLSLLLLSACSAPGQVMYQPADAPRLTVPDHLLLPCVVPVPTIAVNADLIEYLLALHLELALCNSQITSIEDLQHDER